MYKGFGANALNVLTGNVYITAYELARKMYLEKCEVRNKMNIKKVKVVKVLLYRIQLMQILWQVLLLHWYDRIV